MRAVSLFLLVGFAVWGQPPKVYRVDTVAGAARPGEAVLAITASLVNMPLALATAGSSIYVGNGGGGMERIGPDGYLSNVLYSSSATALAVDGAGVIYSVNGANTFVKLDPAFAAGTTISASSGSTVARSLTGIAVDPQGNVLLADQGNARVLRVAPGGALTVLAGSGALNGARLSGAPIRIAVSSSNRIYITQTDRRIVQVSGIPSVVAGNGLPGTPAAGMMATETPFGSLESIAVNRKEEVFAVDRTSRLVVKIGADGTVETLLKGLAIGAIAFDDLDRLVYLDVENKKILRLEANGSSTLIAGGAAANDTRLALSALLNRPGAVAAGERGEFLIADTENHRVLRVSADGGIETIVGDGMPQESGDGGPGKSARVNRPEFLALDEEGSLYIGSSSSARIRKLSRNGIIDTVAGSGAFGSSVEEGPAKNAVFLNIKGLAVGGGRIFICDGTAQRVRRVDPDGIIRNLAGTGGRNPETDPADGIAVETALTAPTAIAVNSRGELAVFENVANRLRLITGDGKIRTISLATLGVPADSDGLACGLQSGVGGMAFDADGSLIVSIGSRICRLDPQGKGWLIGGAINQIGFEGDGGLALSASYRNVLGVSVDGQGNILIADSGNGRIRRMQLLDPATVEFPRLVSTATAGGSRTGADRAISPGGFATLYGWYLAPEGTRIAAGSGDILEGQLPTRLAGVCVEVGGRLAFLTFVGTNQINYQTPSVPTGSSTGVRVVRNCGTENAKTSNALMVTIREATPELLYWSEGNGSTRPVVAVSATGEYIGPAGTIPGVTMRPARPGEVVTIYGIGFGPTDPAVAPGAGASGAAVVPGARVLLGGREISAADLLYVGASPGIAGLYQVNLRVPADGTTVSVQVISRGVGSPTEGFLAVQR